MSTEFGWWQRDPDLGKYQVRAAVHGGQITWSRKQGHHARWEEHRPTETDWELLLEQAGRRVPRRLLSPRQFDEIRRLRERGAAAGPA